MPGMRGSAAQLASQLHVDLLSIVVSGTVAAHDQVHVADLSDQLGQLGSGGLGIHAGAGVVGGHEQLVNATGQSALLELGLVDGSRTRGNGHSSGTLDLGGQLSSHLQSVQVVHGDGVLRLGVVQRAITGDLDVLIVRNHLECSGYLHLEPSLHKLVTEVLTFVATAST